MAGGPAPVQQPKHIYILLAVLWVLAISIVGYLYVSHRFTLYLDTQPVAEEEESAGTRSFAVASGAFGSGGMIPAMYTCDAKQVSPPLSFLGVPDDAHSLVLIMEDRDIPKDLKADGTFLHWTVFDIPPTTASIETGEVIGVQGSTGNGVAGYIGPCPPRGREPALHHYYFDVYALDATLDLPEGASVTEIRRAMQGHELAHATLMGTYERVAQ